MDIIITIGISIIMLGIGLFIGKLFSSSPSYNDMTKQSIFKTWINNIKQNMAERKAEKQLRTKLKKHARMEALKQMQPELVKHMIEEERKKITGEDKKEKLQKFANAFSMSGTGVNSEQKLNNMLGGNQNQGYPSNQSYGYNQPGPTTAQAPPRKKYNRSARRPVGRPRQQPVQQPVQPQQNDPFSTDKLNMMLGGNTNNNHGMNLGSGNAFSDDKLNMMLGKTNKKPKKEMSDEEKLKRLLG